MLDIDHGDEAGRKKASTVLMPCIVELVFPDTPVGGDSGPEPGTRPVPTS
jgi:hypothetical protein